MYVFMRITAIHFNADTSADDAFVNLVAIVGGDVEHVPAGAVSDQSFEIRLCAIAPAIELIQHKVIKATCYAAVFQAVAADALNLLNHAGAAVAMVLATVDKRETGWCHVRHS